MKLILEIRRGLMNQGNGLDIFPELSPDDEVKKAVNEFMSKCPANRWADKYPAQRAGLAIGVAENLGYEVIPIGVTSELYSFILAK